MPPIVQYSFEDQLIRCPFLVFFVAIASLSIVTMCVVLMPMFIG